MREGRYVPPPASCMSRPTPLKERKPMTSSMPGMRKTMPKTKTCRQESTSTASAVPLQPATPAHNSFSPNNQM